MLIVVASGNIFRREFSSYVLGEAGYAIVEVRTATDLMSALRAQRPKLIVLDLQIEEADPTTTLRAVRLLSAAPILWLADPQRFRPQHLLDEFPSAMLSWPFRGDDLVAASATLLGGAGATATNQSLRERFAGSSE